MHHIHHTEGIILGSRNFGETGKYYSIFTRDLGLVYASAQGVRKMSSKLRFVLSDYSHIKVDLVKGKDLWRVTSASKTGSLEDISKDKENFVVFVSILNLLKRLLAGQEANETLFTDLVKGFNFLEKVGQKEPARNAFSIADAGGDNLRNIEIIIVLRMLNNLGYIGAGETSENIIKSPFEENLVFEVSKNRSKVLEQINKALKETHL